jgi:hypothetical protein
MVLVFFDSLWAVSEVWEVLKGILGRYICVDEETQGIQIPSQKKRFP